MERAVVLILSTFVVGLSTGCAQLEAIKNYPSRERAWCYPKASHSTQTKRSFVGVRCYF